MITGIQIAILLLAVAAYAAGGVGSALGLLGKKLPAWFRWCCLLGGIAACCALLVWHTVSVVHTQGEWYPLSDNLSALLTLAVLLAGFVAYVQIRRPIPSLEWLIMPIVIALLLMAGHFGKTQPEAYTQTAYSISHRVTTFLGTIAFVVAGAGGILYLISYRRLRLRPAGGVHAPPAPGMFGSLERLEHLTYHAVTLGFALFSIGLVTGIAWVVHENGRTRLGVPWYASPKVILSAAVWLMFAVILHSPIAPRLRGRRTAILSIMGLILTLATLFAVLLMPKGGV